MLGAKCGSRGKIDTKGSESCEKTSKVVITKQVVESARYSHGAIDVIDGCVDFYLSLSFAGSHIV